MSCFAPATFAMVGRGIVARRADHLLERASMVEGEDVQKFVVSELFKVSVAQRNSLPVNCVSLLRLWRASIRRTVPERERITIESVTAPSRA